MHRFDAPVRLREFPTQPMQRAGDGAERRIRASIGAVAIDGPDQPVDMHGCTAGVD